ncbi:Ankyrin repeat protein [Giardia duodenalis]|uniref:Ankyrin repeat protein n=1 Tax=Giardia intestinalis TaxID=5741 RepID=V6TMA8_GIAIN|nr:Ankyrin repeat protein [Giardia intestinalis]
MEPDLSAVEDVSIRIILEKIFVLDPKKRPTARELANRLRTLNSSTSELSARDLMSDESHRSYIISDSSSSKSRFSWTPLVRTIIDGDIKTIKRHPSKKGKKSAGDDIALMIAAKVGHADIVELLDPTDEDEVTALMRAAERGDVEVVRALIPLQKGRRTEYLYGSKTALMRAATRGYEEVVKLLVEYEGGLKDEDGWTALMYAAHNNYTKCIVSLLEKEAGMQDKDSQTALMFAAARGHVECVKLLLEREARLTDIHGWTALVHAARAGHREIAELLMEHEKDITGWTMLMCAAALGDVDMVSQHIDERGQKDKLGRTALILAAQSGREEVVRLLMEHEGGVSSWTSLIYAAYLGDIDAVKDKIHEKGCKDVIGRTGLMWAAYQGHKGVVEVLLEHEKGIRDNQNHNALYHAFKNRHVEAAKVIMPHEDPADENGVTELMRAAARGDIDMVRLLIPNQKGGKDKNKKTAFQYALENRHIEIATLLYEHEVPSWTPLMRAAFLGDIETVKQYLSDKDKKNEDGDTAYTFAAKAGQGAILELLDPTDRNGVTALMRAAERGDAEAVKALVPLQKGRKMTKDVTINGWQISRGTALMRATACGHAKVVRLLVEHEGGMQDNCGYTALMWAAYSNNPECVKLLARKEKGMKTTHEWNGFPSGTTALGIAKRMNHTEIVSILRG